MKMKCRNFLIVIAFIATSTATFAQSNLLNAKTPSEIGKKTPAQLISDNDKPLPYGYVHDRDVLLGKTTWEVIDLDERINFPLYFPIDTNSVGKDRRSLFDVLLKGIKSGKITEVYVDSYFNTKKTYKDMLNSLKYVDTTDPGREEINNNRDLYYPKAAAPIVKKDKKGNVISSTPGGTTQIAKVLDAQFINTNYLSADYVSQYKIKGYWYFDKRQSELKYRLLGICPMTPEAKDKDADNPECIELFWIYFPSVRDILNDANSFNDRNSAMPISFDHLLNSRKFNGVIYQEENVYGDRSIEKYMKENSQMQLLESERVKDKIRDFEQDMWNY